MKVKETQKHRRKRLSPLKLLFLIFHYHRLSHTHTHTYCLFHLLPHSLAPTPSCKGIYVCMHLICKPDPVVYLTLRCGVHHPPHPPDSACWQTSGNVLALCRNLLSAPIEILPQPLQCERFSYIFPILCTSETPPNTPLTIYLLPLCYAAVSTNATSSLSFSQYNHIYTVAHCHRSFLNEPGHFSCCCFVL